MDDMLDFLIERVGTIGEFNGIVPHLVDDELSILQYMDDMILFMDHDLAQEKKS